MIELPPPRSQTTLQEYVPPRTSAVPEPITLPFKARFISKHIARAFMVADHSNSPSPLFLDERELPLFLKPRTVGSAHHFSRSKSTDSIISSGCPRRSNSTALSRAIRVLSLFASRPGRSSRSENFSKMAFATRSCLSESVRTSKTAICGIIVTVMIDRFGCCRVPVHQYDISPSVVFIQRAMGIA